MPIASPGTGLYCYDVPRFLRPATDFRTGGAAVPSARPGR